MPSTPSARPLIRLHALGRLDIRSADGNEIRSVLQQPKRLALLAYLAIAGARSFQRRDTLLALFWPESDEERARNALSQAIYQLRRSLGDGVLVNRGDEEVGLDSDCFWCDAVAFADEISAGRDVEALALYRGDLLEGLHVAGAAPELAQWIDRDRSRLHEMAAAAAWRLSEAEERSGNQVGAAHWARRGVELSAGDESAIQQLIALLDRHGDQAGAIRAYEEFTRFLAEAYELEPSPGTRELVERVRAGRASGEGLRLAPPSPIVAPPPVLPSPVAGDLSSPPETDRPLPTERAARHGSIWSWRGAAVVLLISLLGMAGIWKYQARTAMASPSASTVAVLPFTVRGDERLGYLADGMVDLLSTNLDGAGDLRSIDPQAILSLLSRSAVERPADQAAEAAAELSARFYVLGSVVGTGGRVRIQAALYDRERGAALVARTAVEGDTTHLFELVDRLTLQILAAQHRSPGDRLIRIAARTTSSLPALRAYLEGESAYRAGRYEVAREWFRGAVDADSTFALAYYSMARAAHWDDRLDVAHRAAEQALRHAGRLAEPDQQLVRAFVEYLRGDAAAAEQRYRVILAREPNNVEAWFSLGHVLFHHGAARGRPFTESRSAFERAYALNPRNTESLVHLIEIAGWERDPVRLDSLLDLLSPQSQRARPMRAIRAFAAGTPADRAELVTEALAGGSGAVSSAASHIAFFARDPAGAAELARRLTDASYAPEVRVRARVMLAQLLAARGRFHAARRELAAARTLAPATTLQYEALLTTLPFLSPSEAELRAVRDRLLAWRPDQVGPLERTIFRDDIAAYPTFRAYLLGVLGAVMGDEPAAHRYARVLEQPDPSPEAATLGHDLAQGVRARAAWEAGDAPRALALLEQMRLAAPWEFTRSSPFHARTPDRFLRASLLERVGRHREALSWHGTAADHSLFDVVYFAPAHLAQARIHARAGEWERAVHHYGQFLELWRDPDPELGSLVEEARGALRRIEPRLTSAGRGSMPPSRPTSGAAPPLLPRPAPR